MSLEAQVKQLNQLIVDRKLVDAIDHFYADDVVMSESLSQAMSGKEANRARERAFVDGLTAWDARLLSSAIDEANGTALNEWILDFNHTEYGAAKLHQVAVQRWRDGRVVSEAFYKLS